MSERKAILIVYDYFYPGYRAGGPIQSLTNLIVSLHEKFAISVFTSAYDLDQDVPYSSVKLNQWNKVSIPGAVTTIVNVFYAAKNYSKSDVVKLVTEKKFSIIYLNGIYSTTFFLHILKAQKTINGKIVVCPRGMLQKGALSVKPFKKKIYLKYLQFSGFLKNVTFHATNEEEKNDIVNFFPKNRGIYIAPNIPKVPLLNIGIPNKKYGVLKLVFLSLITEKKNLLLLLQIMSRLKGNVYLDIYGPIKDKKYWEDCKELIQQFPEQIFYKGEIEPQFVQSILSQYEVFILLTKGENFGHAIYEALSVGRPVITSYFTPWENLQNQLAGTNVDIYNENSIIEAIENFRFMSQQEFADNCIGAHNLAKLYYQQTNALEKYSAMFSI